MNRERVKDWLAITGLKGIKKKHLHMALKVAGSPEEIFKSKGEGLKEIDRKLGERVRAFNDWDDIEREMDDIEEAGARILTIADEQYPAQLSHIYDPPLLLFLKGPGDLKGPQVAIVGTRVPTPYGHSMALKLGRDLAEAGVTVVSGMARGCDSAAHKGALAGGGPTVAVLGTGIDTVYPRENRRLYDEIAASGLLISEFRLGTSPHKGNFPQRNRIVSGLTLGVVVAEAPVRSGAMMTARFALEEGREVFAVPGPVSSPKSAGTNKLIKDGAYLVEEARDIVEPLGWGSLLAGPASSSDGEDNAAGSAKKVITDFGESSGEVQLLLDSLTGGAEGIDALAARVKLPVQTVSTLLLDMELKGYVTRTAGAGFALIAH